MLRVVCIRTHERRAASCCCNYHTGVPKTKPLSELQAPVTKVTTLENGLRVATQETYGPVRQVCVVCLMEWDRPTQAGGRAGQGACGLVDAYPPLNAMQTNAALHLWAGGGRGEPGRGARAGGRRVPLV